MATPVNDSYTAPSGVTFYAGRHKTSALPAWRQSAVVGEWMAIAGTSGGGGCPFDDFSGFALTPAGEIVAGACGGHNGSADNRTVSLDLMADAPAWVLRHAKSPTFDTTAAYNADGQPASAHTYQMLQYVPGLARLMRLGLRFTVANAVTYLTVDGFNLATNAWDAAGTWPNVPYFDGGSVVDGSGNIWMYSGTVKGTVSGGTLAWSTPLTVTAPNRVRYGWCWSARRNEMFALCIGNGDTLSDVTAYAIRQVGNVQTQITINASATLTAWLAEGPTCGACGYDPDGDRYLFYSGMGSAAGKVYVITPNAGTAWDMSVLPLGPGSATPPATPISGIQSRFWYVAALKGFVMLPSQSSNLYFLRMA